MTEQQLELWDRADCGDMFKRHCVDEQYREPMPPKTLWDLIVSLEKQNTALRKQLYAEAHS